MASFVPLAGPRALVRVLVGGAAAAAGYTTYQAMEAKAWLEERLGGALGSLRDASLLMASAVGAAMPAGIVREQSQSDDSLADDAGDEPGEGAPEGFNGLLRRMVEVRALLRTVSGPEDDSLALPSIVVVGGQSSGKSSVLEAIVGREFLPKGGNAMVTRRPLELALVHTPGAGRAYAVFGPRTADGPRMYDFAAVRAALEHMNAAVPADDGVSEAAIELSVHAADVPDLTLVDLPGFVQLSAAHQPPGLRERIARLAERYIRRDNIVLAVCPADVDLANSEALRASRAVDPAGERTLGVLTKLDLVAPETAAALLAAEHTRYPLALGYVGVACPPGAGGARIGIAANDRTGVGALRRRMCAALESRMAAALGSVSARVSAELAAARYALKVEFADRIVSPAEYAADVAADARQAVASVAQAYGPARVCDSLRALVHSRALGVLREAFWSSETHATDERAKHARLKVATDRLTHSGVGRASADSLVDAIVADVRAAIGNDAAIMLRPHTRARERVLAELDAALRTRCEAAAEAVENALRPLKTEMAWTADEWNAARTATHTLLCGAAEDASGRLRDHERRFGHRRLVRAARAILGDGQGDHKGASFFGAIGKRRAIVLDKDTKVAAIEAARMHTELRVLRERAARIPSCKGPESPTVLSSIANAIRSRLSLAPGRIGGLALAPSPDNTHVWHSCQTDCPEVFLHIVAERLAHTAALHVHEEVVREFVRCVPGVVSSSLCPPRPISDQPGGDAAGSDPRLALMAENPAAMRQWTLQERMRVLEDVQQRLAVLQHMRR